MSGIDIVGARIEHDDNKTSSFPFVHCSVMYTHVKISHGHTSIIHSDRAYALQLQYQLTPNMIGFTSEDLEAIDDSHFRSFLSLCINKIDKLRRKRNMLFT